MLDFLTSVNPTLTGALGFFMGLLVGHRLTLAQHRRQEYNVIAGALRQRLLHALSIAHWPVYVPSEIELDGLQWYMRRSKYRALRKAVERHAASYEQNSHRDELGSITLHNPEAVRATLKDILALVKLR